MEKIFPRKPSKPKNKLPAFACDTHTHVFGPFDEFPLEVQSSYTPPYVPFTGYIDYLDEIGAERGVIVQPAPYQTNNDCLLDAIKKSEGRIRGVGVADGNVSDKQLEKYATSGIKALRFTEMRDPIRGGRYKGAIGADAFYELSSRMKEYGFGAQFWAACADFPELIKSILKYDIVTIIEHMGWLKDEDGVSSPAFQNILSLLKEGRIWVKLSVCRNGSFKNNYENVRPFHDALIEANSDRLVWASDWPHVRMADNTPDAGYLVDTFFDWVDDKAIREKILVENPIKLYGFS